MAKQDLNAIAFRNKPVPCFFAAGDVRSSSVKRVAFGVGEGAIGIQFAHGSV